MKVVSGNQRMEASRYLYLVLVPHSVPATAGTGSTTANLTLVGKVLISIRYFNIPLSKSIRNFVIHNSVNKVQ